MHAGEIDNSLQLAKNFLKDNNKEYQNEAILFLSNCHSRKPFQILTKHLKDSSDIALKTSIIQSMTYARFSGITDTLINLLSDENKEIVIESIIALGLRGDKKAVYALVNKFNKQDDIDVRINIAEALVNIGSSNAEDFLLKCLADKTIQVRIRAISALGTIQTQVAVEHLTKELNHPDPSVRITAIESLGKLGNYNAINPLVQLLSVKHQNENFFFAIVNAFGKIKNDRAVSALIMVVNDKNFSEQIHLSALYALCESNSEKALPLLMKILKEKNVNNEMVKTAIRGLGNFKYESTTDILFRILNDSKFSIENRKIAMEALGNIGTDTVKNAFLQIIRDKNRDNELKIEALNVLGALVSEKDKNNVTEACTEFKNHINQIASEKMENIFSAYKMDSLNQKSKMLEQKIQICTFKALGHFSSEKVATPMLSILIDNVATDDDRVLAADILKNLGTEMDVDSLEMELKDEKNDIQTRLYAAEVLGVLGSDKAIESLIQMLRHPVDAVRLRAVKALAASGCEMAVEPLMELSNDKNDEVRKYVEIALIQIRSSSVPTYNSPSDKGQNVLRNENIHGNLFEKNLSIEQLKALSIDSMVQLSKRLKAIEILGEQKTPSAGKALIEIVSKTRQYYHFKAFMALKKSGYVDGLALLKSSLDSEAEKVALWRKVRDRNTDKFADTNMAKWREELELYQPRRALLFELADAISTIDTTGQRGFNLLTHELVEVRAGAYTGLSKHPNAQIVKMLYRFGRKNNNQLFQQCIYRAIDGILLNLEASGGKKELDELEKIKSNIRDTTDAVYSRLEWTVDKINEHIHK
jgi:HEAT repeat protein